jgi:hypothetical protein
MDFPIDPVLGQEHFAANQSWTWDGTVWVVNNSRDTRALHGYPIELLAPQPGDVLRFDGARWVNVPDSGTLQTIPVQITSVQTNDLLRYNGSKWVNVRQTVVVDGGNF